MVNNWFNIIQYKLFPPSCIICDAPGLKFKDICQGCHADLCRNLHHCPCCAKPLETETDNSIPCGQCQRRPPPFEHVIAPFLYQQSLRWLITGLKFRQQLKNARLLGQLFVEQLPADTAMPDFIVPVPLHPGRYRQRGFNQSLEIARTVATQLAIPLHLKACSRVKFTQPQSGLKAKQRHRNIRQAFQIVQSVEGLHLVLFDDVMTTGATVSELAKTLKKAGARRVDIWVCARA